MYSGLLKFFRLIDGLRRVTVNLIFLLTLLLLAAVAGWLMKGDSIDDGTLLSINLRGTVQEAHADSERTMLRSALGGSIEEVTRLHDVLEALRRAEQDPRIAGVVLQVDAMSSAGMASVREIGSAVDRYREKSGKKVWVWGTGFTQAQYLIAAHADHVGLHPMGHVMLKGLSSTSLYWGNLLGVLGLKFDVYKAGTYKSAPEVLTSDEPSKASLLAQKSYMDEAWGSICRTLENRRGLVDNSVNTFLSKLPEAIESERSLSEIYLENGLIDAIETQDEFMKKLAENFGVKDPEDLLSVDYADYLADFETPDLDAPGVVVIVAEGEMIDIPELGGMSPEAVVSLIDQAQETENLGALVLRINTPGGDALCAEIIRARLERFKTEKKVPVVVSMGDTAASGGYWVATVGDLIVADPQTVTGSVGVFAMRLNAERLRDAFEVGRGGYRTTELADLGNPVAEPSKTEAKMVAASVRRTYGEFKRLVRESRKLSAAEVDKLAGGRVWMGSQAHALGLADRLGGWIDAVNLARKEAGLPLEAPVVVLEPQGGGFDGLWEFVVGCVSPLERIQMLINAEARLKALFALADRPLARAPVDPAL